MAILYDWYENPGESDDSEEKGLHPRIFLNGKVGTDKLCRMIHGRYDVICPATNAWELAQVLPQAKLTFIQDGGHAARDPGMTDAIVAALDEFRSLD